MNMALNVNQLTRGQLIYNKYWQNDILNCDCLSTFSWMLDMKNHILFGCLKHSTNPHP